MQTGIILNRNSFHITCSGKSKIQAQSKIQRIKYKTYYHG